VSAAPLVAVSCTVCGARGRRAFRSAYADVHKCGNRGCGHLFAAGVGSGHGVMHEPDAGDVEKLYRRRNEALVGTWRRRGFLSEDSRLLDVGAGTGHLVRTVRRLLPRTRICCVEQSPTLASGLAEQGFEVLRDLAALPAERRFDAVLLIEVVEHVADPVALLAQLRRRLAPGGRIFLTTPCGELRTGSRRTNAYDTPEHVHFFTEASLRLAVRSAGFADVAYEYVDALYPRAVAPGLASLKASVRRAIVPLLTRVQGPRHLTGFLSPDEPDPGRGARDQ
jgi:SAM-dependent methyltransferase